MTQLIETIIFDLGGVFIDYNPEYYYRTIFKNDSKKMQWFLENVCTPEWNIEQDAGRTIEEANRIKIAEHPTYEKEIRSFYENWRTMCKGTYQGTLDIFEAIKNSGKYNYYALTNFSAETWPIATEMFPYLNTFQGVVVSGHVKMRKPFAPIYEHLLTKYDINPTTAVFIDDSLPNIEMAKELGIHGIHFQSPEQLKRELEKLNIQL
ncbi:HAD family hydrolase [Flavicella marina]|uniref:HAD family hydrolase n=1 Tax=Flavicella marina TaxID=1475951 RepID=UPI001264EF0B|nr:HAD family phosphatase [Flavicella marina]